jgi:dTDP-4-amino-4,6-dideoxygalactose transaminase
MNMKVERYNYASQFGNDIQPLLRVIGADLRNGNYILTEAVEAFEVAFANYIGCHWCVGTNSGTDALILALLALGVGRGDEVITQANTFYATVAAICFVGATPVLVDAEPHTYLMDIGQIESAISPCTKAIIAVHLFGKCTPMTALLALAKKHQLKVIEDAAQSHGAQIDGRAAGRFGDIGCFSFHPSKNLAAAGDAGAIVTDDPQLAAQIKVLRALGQSSQNQHVALGMNSKLDAIQARVLSSKLGQLEHWNDQRRAVASHYISRLHGLPLSFQARAKDKDHVYHLFQVRTEQRDELLAHLQSCGVDAVVRYPTPIHLQEAFVSYGWQLGDFPVAESLARQTLCLPLRPDMDIKETDLVCDCIHTFFERWS